MRMVMACTETSNLRANSSTSVEALGTVSDGALTARPQFTGSGGAAMGCQLEMDFIANACKAHARRIGGPRSAVAWHNLALVILEP